MDKVRESYGIQYNSDDGRFFLHTGLPYRITAKLSWNSSNEDFFAFGLFDESSDKQVAPLAEVVCRRCNSPNASGGVLDVIHTPAKDGWYFLKMAEIVNGMGASLLSASSFMNVVALSKAPFDNTTSTNHDVSYDESSKIRENTTEPGYLQATFSQDQHIFNGQTWSEKSIIMDTVLGNIAYSATAGIFALKGGKTYRITAQLWTNKYVEGPVFGLFNVTTECFIKPMASSRDGVKSYLIDTIYTPRKDDEYCLKFAKDTSAHSDIYILRAQSFMNIVALA